MHERRIPWGPVLAVVSLVLTGALIAGYLWALRGPVQAYYRAEYAPVAIGPSDLGTPPPAFRLTDVPWLSEAQATDTSVALRMLAAQQGHLEPRGTLDFLTGTTWGASPVPGLTGFTPGQDPESGLLRAAPQLGFTRRYLTTDNRDEFLLAVRTLISKGRAVRVVIDRAQLLDHPGLEVHGLVLIGYDAGGFEYYEPSCDDPKRCQPDEKAPGSPGLTMKTDRLTLSEEAVSLALIYPWKYQLQVLDPAPSPALALEATLRANARALIGRTGGGPTLGSALVEQTARSIENHGDGVVSDELLRGVKLAAAAREDDAQTLAALFGGSVAAENSAKQLEAASHAYARALTALTAKELVKASAALHEAAAADRAAGEALDPQL